LRTELKKQGAGGTEKRAVLLLIWLMMLVAYFDRVNISLAGPTVMAALSLNKAQFGWVLSAFQIGYALTQMPGGYLADRIGARPLLLAALLVWSAFTALTGMAGSLAALVTIRGLFGVGEGLENGAQFKLIGDHFDSRERSTAGGLFLTAIALGPALASPIVAWLIGQVGWRGLFLWSALPGVLVCVLLYVFLPKSVPAVRREIGATDRPLAAARPESDPENGITDGKRALSQPASWLAFAAYLFFNVGFWGFVYWMPTYLSASRHITLSRLGVLASIPFLAGFVGLVTLGRLASHARFQGYRAYQVAAGYVSAAACLYAAFTAERLTPCVAALSLAAFFLYGGFGPFWAIALDLVPARMRGAFTGFVNTGGQIGGILAPVVVGRIVERTRSFTGGFVFMMAALVLSAASLAFLHRVRRGTPIRYGNA
jgi:sugar phosphate permease